MFTLIKTLFSFIAELFSDTANNNNVKPSSAFVKLLEIACVALACVAVFFYFEKNSLAIQLAEQKAQLASQISATKSEAQERIWVANKKADALIVQLQNKNIDIQNLKEEKQNAIQQYTHHRPCLNARLVSLLNTTEKAGSRITTLPPTAAELNAAYATAATDTDVASWITHAQAQYETLRQRYHALIAWHESGTSKQEQEQEQKKENE